MIVQTWSRAPFCCNALYTHHIVYIYTTLASQCSFVFFLYKIYIVYYCIYMKACWSLLVCPHYWWCLFLYISRLWPPLYTLAQSRTIERPASHVFHPKTIPAQKEKEKNPDAATLMTIQPTRRRIKYIRVNAQQYTDYNITQKASAAEYSHLVHPNNSTDEISSSKKKKKGKKMIKKMETLINPLPPLITVRLLRWFEALIEAPTRLQYDGRHTCIRRRTRRLYTVTLSTKEREEGWWPNSSIG